MTPAEYLLELWSAATDRHLEEHTEWMQRYAHAYEHTGLGATTTPVAAMTPAGGFTGWIPLGSFLPDPEPEPPTERLPDPEPRSEWCCGGTCLRELCDYHRDE